MAAPGSIGIPEACTVIVWAISFFAVIWRYTGTALDGTPDFLVGTGIALAVLQVFSGILIWMCRYVANAPFGVILIITALIMSSFSVHIAVTGGDIARMALAEATVPVNVVGFDIAIIVCQAIFISSLFSLAFNAGSHEQPPPWAHRSRTKWRNPRRFRTASEAEEDIVYASAHNIGEEEDDTEA